MRGFKIRRNLWMLGLAVATAVTAPAPAQFGLTSGIGDAFRPSFTTRDVQLAVDMLQLDDAQRFILETLFEDYGVEFQTGVDSFRERIADLRNIIDPDNPDPGQIMRVVFGNVEEWRVESQQIADQFMEDLKGLLNEEQLQLWPTFERKLFRLKVLKNGQLSAENIDLVAQVNMLGLSESQMQGIVPMLNEYEAELDHALRQREAYLAETQPKLIQAVQQDDPRFSVTVAARQVELHEAVRNVNERYVDIIAAAMGDRGEEFLNEVRQQTYPRVYRTTQADRIFRAALVMEGISDATRDAIAEIYAQYELELATFNARIVQMIRTHEPKEIRHRVEQSVNRMAGGPPERLPDPTREEYVKRRDMSSGFVDQLRVLLTPEQFAGLPGARRWLSPEERAALGEAISGGNKGLSLSGSGPGASRTRPSGPPPKKRKDTKEEYQEGPPTDD